MDISPQTRCTAFAGPRRIASGELRHVALVTRKTLDHGAGRPILVFDDKTSRLIELDLRGTVAELMQRIEALGAGVKRPDEAPQATPRSGPGRPRLGVVAREVTLLPRHWQWLGAQPGGASVALRKLVEDARRGHAGSDHKRDAQESAYRFMSALAGDAPGFEEATRALFAADEQRFEEHIVDWPEDVREHAQMLAVDVFKQA
ncbi:MAG: DUF2239 family protein [Lysobacter sp.]|nr:DUF2239 family protein [Lysobacter sp.]